MPYMPAALSTKTAIKHPSNTHQLTLLPLWICCAAAVPCRNWVLATNTLQAAQHSAARSLASPVVAIVGKGHIPGMVYVMEKVVDVYTDALASHMMEDAEAGAAAAAGATSQAGLAAAGINGKDR
jgi:hypothetical protein